MTGRPPVVCLGEALIDITPASSDDLSTASRLVARPGGAPLNVAVHLRRAGVDSLFLGTLSEDSFGDRIRAALDRHNVAWLPKRPVKAPTRLALIEDRAGHPPFRFYGYRPADSRLTLAAVRQAIAPGASALYVSSLMMIDSRSRAVQMAAIRLANELGIAIASDPNPRPSAWPDHDSMVLATESLLAHTWIYKVSLDDARALHWPVAPDALSAHLRARYPGQAVITDGTNGCWLSDADGALVQYSVPEAAVVDPTGAGDSFFARIVANAVRDGTITPATMIEAAQEGARVAGKRGAF